MNILTFCLCVIIALLLWVIWSFKRQVKDICRQIRFLREHDSNMRITKEMDFANIGELTELLNELLDERKKERIEYLRKEQMIADTYTNLSHDIRTPLTSLDGYFQLLENSVGEEEKKRYIGIIQERIGSLKDMLEELFAYTRLQNENYVLKLERQNVNHILKETVFSYYDNWIERKITPKFDITEEPIWIKGNEQALRRSFQNIIKNGLEHGNKEIEISLQKLGNESVLVFRNKVMNPEKIDISRIFDRFYKADEARSKNSTGLGLSIAKGFVERMDGKIAGLLEDDWFCIKMWFGCDDGGIK